MPPIRTGKTAAAAPTTNRLRIIGGRWRSRVIQFPSTGSLRPTPDRVRETLFNWLGQDLTGLIVLDLFAGSGALAFEALSRGAARAVAVDASPRAVDALRDNAVRLQTADLEAHRGDAVAFLARERRRFDAIFVDPPFAEPWMPRLWPLLPARTAPGGWLYVEQREPVAAPVGWEIHRQRKAGQVHYHLLRRMADIDTDAAGGADAHADPGADVESGHGAAAA